MRGCTCRPDGIRVNTDYWKEKESRRESVLDRENQDRLARRIRAVRLEMEKKSADAYLVTKKENKYYLSLFKSTSFHLIITKEKNYLLTDFRYIEAAGNLEPLYEIVETRNGYGLEEFLSGLGLKNLAMEFDDASVTFFNKLKKALPDTALESFDGVTGKIRSIKDSAELEATKQAEHIGDLAFEYILGEIRPGVSEKEIAFKLEFRMRELGASALSFDTICVSGIRSSMPHGEPTDKLIEKGDLVTMDFGCVFRGYCSDMTRTVAVGSVTDKQRRVYETVLEAQKAAAEAMRPGVSAADVDKAARDVIDQAGFKGFFGHSLGHGTGLEIHETPFASPVSSDILQAGMTLTDEPGIYIPGEFGVRVEDLCTITENGIINFTESEKELIIL